MKREEDPEVSDSLCAQPESTITATKTMSERTAKLASFRFFKAIKYFKAFSPR
jgi:hypothetical protein